MFSTPASSARALLSLLPLLCAAPLSGGAPLPQGTPIGFEETFALAEDRTATLGELVPGTAEYYYYSCLHAQNEGDLDEVPPLLALWRERHGEGAALREIENRQVLLRYERDAAGTYRFLRERLGLRFDQERKAPGAKPDLPTRLDPALVSFEAFAKRALERDDQRLRGFADSALEKLAAGPLTDAQLRELLSRLGRPDVPNLAALVVRDLTAEQAVSFGSHAIHRALTLEQLEECARLVPELLRDGKFVDTFLARLVPSSDVAWRDDAAERSAYLDRLLAFVRRLPAAQDSLKAHVLYHRLEHDWKLGRPDEALFREYLALPREASYVDRERLKDREVVDLARKCPTGLSPVGDDEPLVRVLLARFLVERDSYEGYTDLVRADWLARLFAETKILAGVGDRERWYSMLDDPAYYERLEERVEIEFAPTQRTDFAADEPVAIDVSVKNVPALLVKVFEIEALNWYLAEEKEVDASIELDGLTASEESTYRYSEGPLRRVRRHFELPALSKPGVYVVELIGNGLASRAVIRKGRLQTVERIGAAGQVLRVLDENGVLQREASVRLGGREYVADEEGEILIPFSTSPGEKTIVLCAGERCSLARLDHRAERYELSAATYVDRESLVEGNTATVLVRPELRVDGAAVGLALLEEPVLTITSRDADDVASTVEVRDLELAEGRELTHEIVVPEGLRSIEVALRGTVRNLSKGESESVSAGTDRFVVNGIDDTSRTTCPLLTKTLESGYVIDVLGKNGEPRADEVLSVHFWHRDFGDGLGQEFVTSLATDEWGRIVLGGLPGIDWVALGEGLKLTDTWELTPVSRSYPSRVQGVAGEMLRVPCPGVEHLDRSVAALLERRAGSYVHDRFDSLALASGYLELRDLPPGNYDLFLKGPRQTIDVRVTAGAARDGWGFGKDRWLELGGDAPLAIQRLETEGEELVVRLANAGEGARVHVFAARYLPAFDPFRSLGLWSGAELGAQAVARAESDYRSGREIGDEYRYVLERRYAKKYPGNMLRRPGLLLNPWAIDETVSGEAGGKFGSRFDGERSLRTAGGSGTEQAFKSGGPTTMLANLDFLSVSSRVLYNLRPDADGVVRVPLARLGDGQLLHAVALDDESTVHATLVREETPLEPRDRRLATAIDPAKHYVERRHIETVDAGTRATIEDGSTAKVESYDTLASIFALFGTLSGNGDLGQFEFLVRWPKLSAEEKRELYSKYACCELHFFLHEKDPEFFASVVRPYLANKAYKTFLDEWLLEEDLSLYLDPWAFVRLNALERILLGKRLAGKRDGVQRNLRELVELSPRDPEESTRIFRFALSHGALEQPRELEEELGKVVGRPDFRDHVYKGPGDAIPADDVARTKLADHDEEDFEDAPAPTGGGGGGAAVSGKPAAPATKKEAKSKDLGLRDRATELTLYRAPSATRAWVESDWWHVPVEGATASLIEVNAFWLDYAAAEEGKPFLSTHFPDAAGSLAEMLCALAVLDLPFEAEEPTVASEGRRVTLDAASPLLLVLEELAPVEPAAASSPILLAQNFYRLDDRYVQVGNEQRDKFVTEEFLTGVAYGCQVVLTNPTSSPRELELLLQIPAGALPVKKGFETRGVPVRLEPFGTVTREFCFYFPEPGTFAHYPAHASAGGELVAFAPPVLLRVVRVPSVVDTESWEHVSQSGTNAEVLAFLEKANLQRLDLSRIAWRMKDRAFFERVTDALSRRHAYSGVLWSFALLHEDRAAAAEYLRHADGFLHQCGEWLDTPLVRIDRIERRAYQHVEFSPLFNGRAHRFGGERRILNESVARQYLALLEILGHKARLDSIDRMSVTYYLLLQDRVEEALACFAKVEPRELPTRLQYDYFRAFLDFFSEDHRIARGIAEPYLDHPVERWRLLFRDVVDQLDEAEGRSLPADLGDDDRMRRQTALAAREPQLELEVEARRVTLDYRNLASCELRYYEMDVELLFSTSPFVQQDSGSFAYVRPTRSDTIALPEGERRVEVDLPAELASSNVLVEARSSGLVRRQSYYANRLSVQVMESYGQLKVTQAETGAPLPRTYVKVYAQLEDGSVRFHKDGYTDLRGRFDYTSLSGWGGGEVVRYAILVLSEEQGAVIREVDAPVS